MTSTLLTRETTAPALPPVLAALRASLVAAGWTATSPDHLTPEAELIAITERWT